MVLLRVIRWEWRAMREAVFTFGGSLPSNVGGLQARSFGRVRFSVNGEGVSWSSGNEVFRSTAVATASLGVMGIVNVMIATAIRNVTIVDLHMVNGDSGGDQLARESSGMASPGSRRKEELVVVASDSEFDRKGLRS